MTETNAPIIVNPSAVPVVANTVVRDIAIVAAAFPILVKLIGARDLTGILQWLQSSDGATVLAIVVPVVLTWWRTRRNLRAKAEAVTVAESAPNSVAIVTQPSPPPAVQEP